MNVFSVWLHLRKYRVFFCRTAWTLSGDAFGRKPEGDGNCRICIKYFQDYVIYLKKYCIFAVRSVRNGNLK